MRDELMSAIHSGDQDAVSRLLAANPDLAHMRDDSGASAIQIAAYHGHLPIAALLAKAASSIDFVEACVLDDHARVRQFLQDEDQEDESQHEESQEDQPDLVNRPSRDGFPPLGLAAFFGHVALVHLLLEKGADPNLAAANAMRVRPLNSAVVQRDLDKALAITRRLLATGCDPDPRQAGGWTPLHSAAAAGRELLVDLLLTHGADRDLESDDGRNASTMAEERGHQALAARLAARIGL